MTEYNRIQNNTITETLPNLPERKTVDGVTVVGFNTLPPQVLKAWGYLPVSREPFNPDTHYQNSQPDITADAVIYHALPKDIVALKAQAKAQIDAEAGFAREKAIPQSALIDQEYQLAKAEAQAFKAAGYPATAIPASIQASMTARGNTAQQEADDILARAAMLEGYLVAVRAARLDGKAAVDAATTNTDVVAARDNAIAAINAL